MRNHWRTIMIYLRILGASLCGICAALWLFVLKDDSMGCFFLGVAFGGAGWLFTSLIAGQVEKRRRSTCFADNEDDLVFFLAGMIVLLSLLLGVSLWSAMTADDVYKLPVTTVSGTLSEDADYNWTRNSEWYDLTMEGGKRYTISETVVRHMDKDAFERSAKKGAKVEIVSAQGHLFGKDSESVFGLSVNEETWLRTEESQKYCVREAQTMGRLSLVACGMEIPALLLLLVLRIREKRREKRDLF